MATIYTRVGGKKLTKVIAMHATVQRRVDEIAVEHALVADALLNARAGVRTHTSQISVDKGDVDAYVVLDDTRGLDAAMTIEYGRKPDDNGQGAMQGLWVLHDAFGLGGR